MHVVFFSESDALMRSHKRPNSLPIEKIKLPAVSETRPHRHDAQIITGGACGELEGTRSDVRIDRNRQSWEALGSRQRCLYIT